MTRNHVLATFRKAGFPLRREGYRYRYRSPVVDILFRNDDVLTVWTRGRNWGADFESPARAVRYIERTLSIQLVHSNEFALRRPSSADLQIVRSA